MERVSIHEVSIGRTLKRPMYSRTGRLLLSSDQSFTRSMRTSLEGASQEFVYLGEWDPVAVAQYETAWQDYRNLSASLMRKLEKDIEEEIAYSSSEVSPEGVPVRNQVSTNTKRQRSRAEIVQVERDYELAMADTRAAVGGGVPDEKLSNVAERVALTVMKRVKTDLDLLLGLVQRKRTDGYFEQHALNTVVLSMSIATAMGYSEDQVTQLGVGALFKDIGMRNAPQELVRAQRRITPSEHVDIQKHTISGLNAIQKAGGLPSFVRFLVYQHHERVDGRGYPKGRRKSVIHSFSRIVSVADAYDSLTSARPWRPAMHPYRAMESLIRSSETYYDNAVLRGLLQYLSLFPVGSLMRLSTGDIVRVIAANPGKYHHPVVFVLKPDVESGLEKSQILDLSEEERFSLDSPFEGNLEGIESANDSSEDALDSLGTLV